MKYRLAFSLICVVVLVLASLTAAQAKKDAKDKETAEEEPTWDVQDPPGDWDTVVIDTTETTWSSVDVSPDGETILFDMLGDIYTVPIAGGEATALTNGIEWNFQPRYSPGRFRNRVHQRSRRRGQPLGHERRRLGTPRGQRGEGAPGPQPVLEPRRRVHRGQEGLHLDPQHSRRGDLAVPHRRRRRPAADRAARSRKRTRRRWPSRPSRRTTATSTTARTSPAGRVWQYNKDSTGQIFAIKRLDRETGRDRRSTSAAPAARSARPRRPTAVPGLRQAHAGDDQRDLRQGSRVRQRAPGLRSIWTATSRRPTAARATPRVRLDAGQRSRSSSGPAARSARVDVETKESEVIPIHVRAEKKIHPALRFPVEVAPDEFDVKMLRWAQMSPDGTKVVFQALGHLYVKDLAIGRANGAD